MSRFNVGDRVSVTRNNVVQTGTIAKIEYKFGYLYFVNIDGVGIQFVNHIFIELIK